VIPATTGRAPNQQAPSQEANPAFTINNNLTNKNYVINGCSSAKGSSADPNQKIRSAYALLGPNKSSTMTMM
jgi:hypothetical protein